VLYERGFGLGYQSRAERYNAPVALALDYDNGDVADDIEPTDDDQQLRNSWTVTRTNGATSSYTDGDSVATEGLYDEAATLNVETDDQVQFVAEWLVHRGTSDDLRWPSIGLRFDNDAGRANIPAWVGLGYGARVTVANLPQQVAADPIDVFIEGKVERFDEHTWMATLNTTPAAPFEVFKIEGGGNLGRLQATDSTLAAAVTPTATSLSVATTTLPLWTTAGGDLPLDIEVGGERMTVTAISGASSPQTFTVTRSVNSISKAQTAGTSVKVWRPGGLAL
jgi:hypothetical protein